MTICHNPIKNDRKLNTNCQFQTQVTLQSTHVDNLITINSMAVLLGSCR